MTAAGYIPAESLLKQYICLLDPIPKLPTLEQACTARRETCWRVPRDPHTSTRTSLWSSSTELLRGHRVL